MFACTLFFRMRRNKPCLTIRYSCGCGRISRVACTLFVRIRTNSPYLRLRYSRGCRRISCLLANATRADAHEKHVFPCTLFGRMRTKSPCLRIRYSSRMRTNSPCLRVRYSCVTGRIGRVRNWFVWRRIAGVCVHAIHAYADE